MEKKKKKTKTKTTSFIKSLIFRSSRDYFTMSQSRKSLNCSYCRQVAGLCMSALPIYCKGPDCLFPLEPICTQQVRHNMNIIATLTDESVELAMHWCKSCIGRAINSQLVTKTTHGAPTESRIKEVKRAYFNTPPEERPRKSSLAANKVVVDLTEEEEEATQPTQANVEPNYNYDCECTNLNGLRLHWPGCSIDTPYVSSYYAGAPSHDSDSEDEAPLVSSPDVDHQVLGPIERLEEDLPRYSRQISLEKEKYPKGAVFVSRRTRNQVYDSFFVTIVKE